MSLDPQTRERLEKLLERQKLAALATQEANAPYLSLMAFTVAEDFKSLIIATKRGTRKYTNIRNNPRVALLIDNRFEQREDFQNTLALTVIGTAREVEDKERDVWASLFLKKHPDLGSFVNAPECVLLRVDLERLLLVFRFEEVEELILTEKPL